MTSSGLSQVEVQDNSHQPVDPGDFLVEVVVLVDLLVESVVPVVVVQGKNNNHWAVDFLVALGNPSGFRVRVGLDKHNYNR